MNTKQRIDNEIKTIQNLRLPDWICHACGKERPDKHIGVVTRTTKSPALGEIQVNQRFCSDNQKCVVVATKKAEDMLAKIVGN